MKIISLSNVLDVLLNLFKQAQDDILLLKLPDGREFILSSVDRLGREDCELDEEVEQIVQNPELMELLKERTRDRAHLSLEEVYQQLGLEDEIP